MIKRAWQAMSSKVVQINWDDTMERAFEIMQEHRLRHLPVVDQEGNLLGIISDRDIQRAMKSGLRWESTIQAKVPAFEDVEFDPDAKVRHYMSWPVKTVDKKTDLRIVAGTMVSDKISAVLVMDGDQLVGIVTTEDLLKILMGLLGSQLGAKPIQVDSVQLGAAFV